MWPRRRRHAVASTRRAGREDSARSLDHRYASGADCSGCAAEDTIGEPAGIFYDQRGLAGRIAILLNTARDDVFSRANELPEETCRVVILDDTPNPMLELFVHPVGRADIVIPVDHRRLALEPRR